MSKIFYDSLIDLSSVEREIKRIAKTAEEREELYHLVDEIVHHKVVGCILDRLPRDHHDEFLTRFGNAPHDTGLIDFLKERLVEDFEEFVRREIHILANELLAYIEEPHQDAG